MSDTEKRQKKQTFVVEILDRQKDTWQGRIHWVEKNRQMPFRSVMEMLYLMNSVFDEDSIIEERKTE